MIQLNIIRKFIISVFSLVLTLSLSGLTSIPAHASVPGNGYYGCATGSFESSTPADQANRFRIVNGTVVDGAQCVGEVVISEGVTAIGAGSFGYSALTSISLPLSITSIENNAFQNATELTSISLPSNLTSIGAQAFSSAGSLSSISIPNSVTSIGRSAFERTALTSITFPEGMTSIPDFAFLNASSLTSVSIPASVSTIGAAPFSGTTALTNIAVASNNQNFRSIDGVLFNSDATTLLEYPSGKSATSYTIPNGVTHIGVAAFDEVYALISIIIPNGVEIIGESAFAAATSLTSITIPSSVNSIEMYAFANATSLASVNIPDGITTIGEYVFSYTALTSITIPSGVTGIGYGAFEGTSTLAVVNFLGNAPMIEDEAFYGVANGAKAYIDANATGFGTESTWNGLEIDRSVSVPAHIVSYNASGGSPVSAQSFTEGGTIATAPTSTRSGYTLAGWSTTAGGRVVTFPFTPGVANNITLHAIWTPIKTQTKTATISYSANFPSGSSVLSSTGKKAISKIVKKAGKNAKYTVTGVASKSVGISSSKVKARAKSRAEAVKAYLIKLGVKKSNITVKIAIVESGITPKTKIVAKYVTK